MNVVSMVANMQKELDYYKEVAKECQAIIKQLTEGPGEFEYMHPWDICELLNSTYPNAIVDIWMFEKDKSVVEVAATGKKYKQSAWIPAKTKRIA